MSAIDCAECRDACVDVVLGQVTAEREAHVRAHLLRCDACRSEARAIRALLKGVRALDGPAPSASFRPRLRARLAAVREEEERAPSGNRHGTRRRLGTLLAAAVVLLGALAAFRVLGPGSHTDSAPRFSAGGPAAVERGEAAGDAVAGAASAGSRDVAEAAASAGHAGSSEVAAPEAPVAPPHESAVAESAPVIDPPAAAGAPPDLAAEPTGELAAAPAAADATGEGAGVAPAPERESRLARMRHLMRHRFAAHPDLPADTAVRGGLKWLVAQQAADGSFDPVPHGGSPEARVGVTGLALAALLVNAERGVPGGLYHHAVNKGFAYLRGSVDDAGTFGAVKGAPDVTLFNHALATYAFAENYALTQGTDAALLDDALVRLDDLSALRANRERRDADNTTAPWVALALETAGAAGVRAVIDVDEAGEVARSFVAKIVDPALVERGAPLPEEQLTAAVALAALDPLYRPTESRRAAPRRDAGTVYQPPLGLLLACLRDPSRREPSRLFFATIDFQQRGGRDGDRWRAAVTDVLLPAQDERGAWRNEYTWDPISAAGGDVYETALAIMTLSAPVRLAR